jgi:hypothetical protein
MYHRPIEELVEALVAVGQINPFVQRHQAN